MPEQTSQTAILPTADAPAFKAHTLQLEDRSRLTVTGVTRIVSCDENGALLKTGQGDLTIGGQGIQIGELSVRTGQVHITGKIEFLQYTENRESSGGLLSRLLR